MALNINSAKIEINAVDNTRSAFESVKNSMRSMAQSSASLSAGLSMLGGALSVAAFVNMAKSALSAADAMNDVAKANEVTVGAVLKLSQALQVSGGESENSTKLFASLTNKLDEAASGSEKAQAQFKKIGVSLKDLGTLDGQKLFEKSLQGLAAIEDPIQRNATAMDLFGKAVKGVDIKGLAEEYANSQGKFDEAEQSYKAIGEAMDKVDKATAKLKESVAISIAPWYTGTIDYLDKLINGYAKLEENIRKANKAQGGGDGKWAAAPKITDNPTFGAFDLPPDFQAGALRGVIDPEVEKAKQKAAADAKEAFRKQEEARKKLNAEKIKDIQDEIDFEQSQAEALYDSKTKAEKELYDNKIKYLDLIQQRSEREFQEELKRQEEIKKADDDRAENINRTITDALMRGFESGVSFAKNFRNTLINMFKTLVLQPVISFIVNPVSGAISAALGGLLGFGNAAANTLGSASSAGGFAGLTSNLFNMITTSNASIVSGIESVGAYIANGMGGVQDTIGGFIGQNSSAIADGFAYAGALFQLAQGNVMGAAGTAIGTYFGGPIGGAIGSFVGNLIGGLFGGAKRYESGVRGTYANGLFSSSNINYKRGLGATDSLSGLSEAFSQSMGTLLNAFGLNSAISTNAVLGKKKKAWGVFDASFDGGSINYTKLTGKGGDPAQVLKEMINSVMSTSLVQAIQKSKLPAGIKSLFDGLTDQTAIQNMIQASLSLSNANSQLSASFGMTADQAAQVAKATGLVGDKMITFINELIAASGGSSKARVLLDARQTLLGALGQDMPTTLLAFDNMIKAIDKSNAAGIDKVVGLLSIRAGFEQYTNAMDSIKLGVSGSTMGLRSTASQKQIMQAELAKMFNALNLAVPSSVEQLVALADSIDYTTEAGINLAMAFPSLVSAFQTANQQVAELAQTLDSTQFKTLVDFTRAQRYQDNGINLGLLPSYASGSDYINGDQIAQIHNGERILTATDNATLMQRLQSPQANLDALIAEIGRLRTENQAQQVAIVIATQKMAKILDKMDNNGVVLSEVDNSGTRIVIDTRTVP